jgi:hypothetical protein
MAWVALSWAVHQRKKSFLPLSPYLHDFSLMFLMLYSPLDMAFFWCFRSHQMMATFGCVAQKQLPRHSFFGLFVAH